MVQTDNYLLKFRQLLNVYIVDMWAKIESERLLYIHLHQKELRVEKYVCIYLFMINWPWVILGKWWFCLLLIQVQHIMKAYYSVICSQCKSVDCDAVHFSIEFLESMNDPGLPFHELKLLKVGVPMILIPDINPPQLCNGTRLIITSLLCTNVLQTVILIGVSSGESVFIPRIPLASANVPFSFTRTQFPVKLCYSW